MELDTTLKPKIFHTYGPDRVKWVGTEVLKHYIVVIFGQGHHKDLPLSLMERPPHIEWCELKFSEENDLTKSGQETQV